MSTEACLALFSNTPEMQRAFEALGDTADLLLMTTVAGLPPRHGRKRCVEGPRSQK